MSSGDPNAAATEAGDTWQAWEARHARTLGRIGVAVLAYGLFWRIARYLMAMPIWGDEAMLLVNYQTRDFGDIFGPIQFCQIAPLLFHWAEMAMFKFFGASEWSVRFPPLVGSVAGLLLYWQLARLTLSPLPRLFAVCVLAVAIWPATTGSLVKPYSWDLLFSVVLLLPFAAWRRDRSKRWPLAALCLLTPLALTASYTAVFVAGAIGLVMIPPVLRSRDRWQIGLLALYGSLIAATFLAHYQYVGKVHMASTTAGLSTSEGMTRYWQNAFPPSDPLKLLIWLPLTFAGEIAAYPIGAQRGGSILTVIICIFGGRALWKQGHADLVMAFIAIIGLWFMAAVMHKYPFGSCRLGQHAAPVFCLLFGAGVTDLLRRFVAIRRARLVVGAIVAVLVIVGLSGQARDVIRPYRDVEAKNSRAAVRSMFEKHDAPILMMQERLDMPYAALNWYLTTSGRTMRWIDSPNWIETMKDEPAIWVVISTFPAGPNEEERFRQMLAQTGRSWTCVEQHSIDVSGKAKPEYPLFRIYLFKQQAH